MPIMGGSPGADGAFRNTVVPISVSHPRSPQPTLTSAPVFTTVRAKNMRLLTTLLASALLTSCESDRKPAAAANGAKQPKPTPVEVIEDLIAERLLRVDINFSQVRSSPEFKDDEYVHWSDSAIVCSLDIHNFSTKNLRLNLELFTHYDWIDILRTSDGEQASSLSANPPIGVRPIEYFDLPADTSKTFGIQYEAFECFHGVETDDGGVRYEFPGDFEIFHRRFPNDRLKFSVDANGIVSPIFDMKIQDGVETKSEQDGVGEPATRSQSK